MIFGSQMIDLEMDQQGQGYLHHEPCNLFGGIANFQHSDIQTMVTASGNTANLDAHHQPEHYDNGVLYGLTQIRGVQHPPLHHAPNLDLGAPTASNFYIPYMTPSSGIPLSHGSCNNLPSSTNYGVIGVSTDEYGTNNHFMDNARGSYKRKNVEGNPGSSQYFNATASSSSSVATLNTRHPDGVALMDTSSFTPPQQHRGNTGQSIRELGSHRSARNRLGATVLDPGLGHNQNHFIQGNYMGQLFQPAGSLWLEQQLSNNSSDAGVPAWTQNPAVAYAHGNNLSGGSIETGSMGPQRYHELSSNRSNTSFLHPSPNLRHHNFHHLPPPIQGMRGHNLNVLPQISPAFRGPTSYASQSNVNPSQDGFDIGVRHPGFMQPTGLRMYRPHREGIVSGTNLRLRNFPHLRVLPTDGVAVLEFPDYYEVDNYVDHHRDMRLDIEDMSYEELLALGEQIGNVNTGLSEEIIVSRLKTRTYLSSPMSINLEETACTDQESNSCIICQDDYKSREKIGTLDCGHEYHADCLKKWLCLKNVCPICKSEALTSDMKDA